MERRNSLARGIILIFIANIINMGFSVLTNFLLPKYLSVESYAAIKTYQLYLSYVGILHFGFNDGMYLRYGGKVIDRIDRRALERNSSTIKLFQAFVSFVGLVLACALRNRLLIFVMLTILPHNLMNYYNSLFQACGEFAVYGRVLNSLTIGMFVVNASAIFLFRLDGYEWYIGGYTLLYFLVWFVLEYFARTRLKLHTRLSDFSFQEMRDCIRDGILLMLGNFSSMFITSMDRWFVKVLLTTVHFAQYSFAVSMESFLNIAVTPVSTTLYNYFCIDCSTRRVRRMRERMVLFGTFLVTAVFPVRFLLDVYLQKYLDAEKVLVLLFASQIFYIVNKSVFNNLYKARKQQNKYFVRLVTAIVIAFVFNVLGYLIAHRQEMFAVGTLLSSVVWLFIVNNDFRKDGYACPPREMLHLIVSAGLFVLINLLFNPIIGFFLYPAAVFALGWILMQDGIRGFAGDLIGMVRSKLGG